MGQPNEDESAPDLRSRLRTVFVLCGPVIMFSWLGWDAHRRGDQVPMGGAFWPMFWVGAIVCIIGPWVAWWQVRSRRK
jgi:hypothetical protein